MPAPIKIKKPVGPGENPPSLNLRFRGKNQKPMFDFRDIALKEFDTDATSLGVLLVLDFVKEHKEFPNSNRSRRLQTALRLVGDTDHRVGQVADKKGKARKEVKWSNIS